MISDTFYYQNMHIIHKIHGRRGGIVVERRTPEREVDPQSGSRVVSLSKIHLLPKSTCNTQEAVAPSQHD